MTTQGKWAFVRLGTKKELLKHQKSMVGKKTRVVPMTILVIDNFTSPARKKHTYKLEKWVN